MTLFSPDRVVLGIFAKWPRPGQVKTRLADSVRAAQLAGAFLRDTLDRMSALSARRVVAFAPPETEVEFAALVGGRYELRPQVAGELGWRMQAFMADRFAEGAERVLLIGADSPTLPISHVEIGFDLLQDHDLVMVPAMDGGYCLIGCAARVPPIFDGIQWSSARVLEDTVTLAKRAHLRLALLPPWYDVDTPQDCQMLRGHIAAMRAAGLDPRVPHTEAVLCNLPPW